MAYEQQKPNSYCVRGEKSKMRCQHCWMSTFSQIRLLIVSSQVEGASQLSGFSFMTSLIPFVRNLLSGPNHLPKAPFPNSITSGFRFSISESEGIIHIQPPSSGERHKSRNRVGSMEDSCSVPPPFPSSSQEPLCELEKQCFLG